MCNVNTIDTLTKITNLFISMHVIMSKFIVVIPKPSGSTNIVLTEKLTSAIECSIGDS